LVRERYYLGEDTSITIIPHGHYINQYSSKALNKDPYEDFKITDQDTVFSFFGQIRPYKQVPHLLRSYHQLKAEETKLVIAGKPSSDALRRTIIQEAGNSNDVMLQLEFIPDEEVAQYFLIADVVVLPYRSILTSGTAVLAMSFGCPVIVPKIGCLGDLVTDGVNGFLYDPDEPDGLEQAMKRALDSNLSGMGESGYQTVREKDWTSIAEKTRRVYES
jgi:glycosyltransferase involved in cell wall biosynthesis